MPECPHCGKFIHIQLIGTEDAKELKDLKDSKDLKDKNKKIYYGDFVQLTVDEFDKLLEKFGKVGVRMRIDKLDSYIGSTGRRHKSHYHTILNWAHRDPVVTQDTYGPKRICKCGQQARYQIGNEWLCQRCFREK